MAVPNPYFVYIELFKADGVTRPNQNEIARVRAYDLNGTTITWEGESGFNPSTGGWFPVYMQNIAAFYPPREKPNLKFEVWNTQEQIVHTTQPYNQIPSASTLKIVIGVSDQLVGGSSSTWLAFGTVRHQDGTPLASGVVRLYDVNNGSEKELGNTSLAANGTYSIGYATADFTNNGGAHAQPNLKARAFNAAGQLLGESGLFGGASNNQQIDFGVPNETTTPPGGTKRKVFGSVQNGLALPVSGIRVEAYHVAWTVQGIQEIWLGPTAPTSSDNAGKYEILYDLPVVGTPENPCGTPAGQVNLIVYAKELQGTSLVTLFTSTVVFDAPAEQQVDLIVNKTAVSTDSEYKRVNDALTPCLGQGDTEAVKWATLNKLNERPEFLSFVSQATGFDEALLRAYVKAWIIAGEINQKVPAAALSRPMSPEVIYALLRVLEAKTLADLLNVLPDDFFDAIVRGVHRSIVAASLEQDLYPRAEFGNKSLLDDWRLVLAKLLNQSGLSWQAQLLNLALADYTVFPEVLSAAGTAFAAAATAHNVPMPATVAEGDLLLVLFANGGTSSLTLTVPAPWVPIWSAASGTTTAARISVYAKKALGNEGGTVVNFQTSVATQGTAQVYRVSKASWKGDLTAGASVVVGTATGTSASLDPPALTTNWLAAKTLWLACASHTGNAALNTTPAGYTTPAALRTSSSAAAGNVTEISARRTAAAASENPASFVLASSATWVAGTVAVREGTVSLADKREAVVNEHFNHQGSFEELLAALVANTTLSSDEAENLRFVFEMYERVGHYYPIVAAVYAQKGAQNWDTIRDLAKVPLESAGSNDWYHYALNSQGYTNAQFPNTFPSDVPGNTADEKARVYAARLLDLFRDVGPQQRFASDLGAAAGPNPAAQEVATFLGAHPEFDLDRTNVGQYAAQHPGALGADAIAKLVQLQRVYRLTSDFAAANALISATPPLDSAVKIARIDEGQFIADWEQPLGGLTAARNIHRTAAHYASEVLFTLVKFHQDLNAVGGMSAVPGPVNLSALNPIEGLLPGGAITAGGDADSRKFPNWVTLFGSLNQCACKECQTALSPGAYLVDLLEFVDGAPKRTLFDRRPDLEDIELTCPNTNVVLPYIDLVNEVLESKVLEKVNKPLRFTLTLSPSVAGVLDLAAGGDTTEFAKVRAAFAAEIPTKQRFLLSERAIAKKGAADAPPGYREWVVEDDAWRFSIRQTGGSFTVYPSPQTSGSNDSLEVFPEHFLEAAYTELAQTVFPMNLPLELGREETEVFLKATGVPRQQVLEAFSVAEPLDELRDPGIARAYLKLTASEANAMLVEGRPAREFWGFASEDAIIPRPDEPTRTVSGNWVNLMSLVPVFLHRSRLHYPELLELLDTQFVHLLAAPPLQGQPHGLHIAAPSEALNECDVNQFQIAHLNADTLKRIGFFLRLWRKLGWTMREVDRYLIELEANAILLPAAPPITSVDETLLRLYHVKRLVDEFKLPPRVVVAFWRPLDTRRTQRNPKSLFDDVFLRGSPTQPEEQALESIVHGGTLTLSTLSSDTDVRAHVRAALRLKAEDFDALWSVFVNSTSGLTLNVDKLSGMYRVAVLAGALKLSVRELFDLQSLIGVTALPLNTPADLRAAIFDTHAAIRQIRIARTAKMSAAAMIYYLTDVHLADDPFTPKIKQLEAAAQRLAAAANEIAAANPEQANIDAIVLSTALAKVMPADKVVRALGIVEAPDHQDGDQVTFVTRYFGAFVSGTAQAFLQELEALPAGSTSTTQPGERVAARYQRVWGLLHGYLIEQARTTTAIAVAAELTGTDQDTANTLLTENLHRTTDAAAAALLDWKAMLSGGWGPNEPVLAGAAPGTRSATLVVPKGGDYRFVASIDQISNFGTVSLQLDGADVALTPVSGLSDHAELVSEPQTLRAGSAHGIRLVFTVPAGSTAKLTLLFRVGNDDLAVVPSTMVVPFNQDAYVKLFKAVELAKGLALSKVELRYLIEHRTVFDFDKLPLSIGGSPPAVPWSSLSALLELLGLNRSIQFKNGTLFEFWRDTVPTFAGLSAEQASGIVAVQTEWKKEDIQVLRGEDPNTPGLWTEPNNPTPAWDSPALWSVLRDCFGVIRRLDIRARHILSLLVRSAPTIGSATALRNVFRARFSKEAWKDVFKPLRDPLRQRQRDALVGYLTTRPMPVGAGGANVDFIDANDLFAYFLIDVEMEPDTLISRVKLALNVVQLFVHRVFLGLEDAAALGELEKKKDQWSWMEKFRVWEANRKVFLYPENWIEPELRDDKTEFFRELEEELTQGPLTHDTALQAFSSYLEKMNEVSNLEVIGSFAEGTPAQGTNFTLHVVGRTRSRSRGLFYRRFLGRQAYDGYWTPWTRINLEIEADVIAPVVVNGRLQLMWPKVVTKERPREHNVQSDGEVNGKNQNAFSSAERVQYQAEIRLMWSEYNPKKNKWGKPKLTKGRGVDDYAPTPFHREIGEDQARTENYHLRVHLEPQHVAVDLIKTNVPVDGKTVTFELKAVNFFFGQFFLPIPKVLPTALLDPKLLGTFRLWDTGEDFYDRVDAGTGLGQNYPIGTVLKSNAAVEVDFTVDNKVGKDTLQFSGNAAFLGRTPGTFRIFETNFNYALGADKQPFFYETNLKSLFALNKPDVRLAALSNQSTQVVKFSAFNHPLVQTFEKELQHNGLEGLMQRLVQALPLADDRYYSNYYYDYYYGSLYLGYHIAGDYRALYTTQRIFESEHAPGPSTVQALYPLPTVEFGYGTSFGIYNWELFFHVPMLIASRLGQDLKFNDAMRWHHAVFDPKQQLNKYERTRSWVETLPPGCRYWNFLPFFANRRAEDSLFDTLGLTPKLSEYERDQLNALIEEWRHNPFNPHLIARQRIAAYQKFVVMKYLDNLIAWADQLFRQDTFETINEATQLYVLADELLGDRPEEVEPLTREPRLTYRELRAKGIDEFSNAIVEVESLIVSNQPYLKDTEVPALGSSMTPISSLALKSFYFRIPRNERLDRYWDTVQDRLFKIRNSMNIDGVKRRLALFEPPIDPGLLVRAAAAGLDIGSVLGQLNAPLPCYRFNTWLQKATDLCNELKSFGGALLSALEKRDAEDLQLLRQGHELKMLALVSKVREQQVKEAEENIVALELSRATAEERKEYYRTRTPISEGEQTQIDKTKAAAVFEVAQSVAHGLSALFAAVPDSKAGVVGPFPTALIDAKIGSALQAYATVAANVAGALASVSRSEGTVAGLRAGFDRRWEDWKLQERLAQKEIDQLNQQIVVASIRLDIAQKELANHEQQIEHAEEVQAFLQDKFSSRDLYGWMVSQLTRTYNQLYKLAFDAARTAERTFQFELGEGDASFIQFGYIDSLRQGLLAGEQLIYDIKRMDVAYLERHKRELELQKSLSLMAFDGAELQRLRETGACEFELPEVLFDLDFAGHYFRRIKGVRLTIPCVTGPHTSVSAKLSLLGSAYRKESAANPDEYAYTGFDDPRFVHDPVGITSIAAGRAQSDPGLFEFNFRDERYLPFEGAGAISRWRLELPSELRQFDYSTISDVVLELSYTARDGGGLLKLGAESALRSGLNRIRELALTGVPEPSGLVRVFSLKKEFPDVLHLLLASPANSEVTLTLTPEHFPFALRNDGKPLTLTDAGEESDFVDVHLITKPGGTTTFVPTPPLTAATLSITADPDNPSAAVSFSGDPEQGVIIKSAHVGDSALLPGWAPQAWVLKQSGMSTSNVDDIVFILKYTLPE